MKKYVSQEDRRRCELFYDSQQWSSLTHELQTTADGAAIEEVTGVRDPQLLAALAELDMDIESLGMLTLIPMIQVAWASGRVEDNERYTLLQTLHGGRDVADDSVVHVLLEGWLKHEPTESMYRAWTRCVSEVEECLPAPLQQVFAEHIESLARQVAKSSGGFFGLGRVCNNESDTLARIRATLNLPDQQ